MKKLVAFMIVLCILFAAACAVVNPTGESALPTRLSFGGTTAETEIHSLDCAAIRALHPDDEIIAKVGERQINWGEYYSILLMNATRTEENFIMNGRSINWDDPVAANTDQTIGEYMTEVAESSFRQDAAIDAFGKEGGVDYSGLEESYGQMLHETMTAALGEGATEDDFAAKLDEMNITMDGFRFMSMMAVKEQANFTQVYGENFANVSDEDAVSFLAEKDYMRANHILFMTADPNTGETLSQDDEREKKKQAEEVYAQLMAIEDKEELVKRFKELKEEYCEDGGKVAYPDGYTFRPGTMVKEFEQACKDNEHFVPSEPVKTNYGYHIVLPLPLDPDLPVSYSNQGQPQTAREFFASEDYAERFERLYNETAFEYLPGFEPIKLSDFVC